ncbi:MAG: flagellar hook-basal body complex protein FliE [Alphaproteobacteria bacterium]|jgi:flagellar hook-basal body complex protein FliE|nr:flagellar hook-basal body complex protein FliE [Alphaproteobacteria bacterium]MBU0803252.1 flagellar hook-basal body complex protein FliE [Alphaproteobacteria bacterium]MBU0870776.1 flagellar hook-basal body complex protein FliE [Alphaproteobacteria bacterium]MBU1403786.1 flagellar hook-basal body complex protein FliE [Alphaproteobacteria bacterium]MBU1589621.1 flagellar hook-basal body complex protein FliE [Alphaproteobacteria bacterium]
MIGAVGALDFKSIGGASGASGSNIAGAAAGASPTASFASVLSDMASRTVETMNNAEHVSIKALQGDADAREVADAVMSAEQSLQAAVAIRDKIISAYMEISRMAI